jgi:hypoxanthine-DNA glycosylase
MPSIKSLQAHQYYAHPRNSFWFIMSALFADRRELDYEQKKALLLHNRIALWDVLKTCRREGSLDSSITSSTIEVNDFNSFFAAHAGIKAVFFNGARAEQEYRKHVLPVLDEQFSSIEYQRLPSTSPAMASLNREQKLQQWRLILQFL